MHITFHVKENCALDIDDLPRIGGYIGGIVNNFGGTLIAFGGIASHVHLLVTIPKTMALSDYLMKIKANSSRWLKTTGNKYRAFSWQDGYAAFSVSASRVDAVKGYIANQIEHHRRHTYQEEVEAFFKAYNIDNVSPLRGSDE